MKIALCEDDPKDRERFLSLIAAYEKAHQKKLSVTAFTSGAAFLHSFRSGQFDAVFLDIYMKDLDGMAVAREIRKTDEEIKLIFTTASTDHFAEGYAVEACHYLVKPLTEAKIDAAMHRLRNIFSRDEVLLTLTSGNRTVKIPQGRIIYIETMRNGIEIHCREECFALRCSLASAMNQLPQDQFIQCHRYFVVNLSAVEQMAEDSFMMCNGENVFIRRDGRKEIKEAYHNYFMKRMRGENV